MPSTAHAIRMPWHDRWSVPQMDDLLLALKAHHRRAVNRLMDGLAELDGVEQSLIWYGPSWKWTLQYMQRRAALRNGSKVRSHAPGAAPGLSPRMAPSNGTNDDRADGLCYIVPGGIMPLVCVPLRTDFITHLPEKRLSKYVRDGIRSAKCAVEIHWAIWAPNGESESGLVLDLIRRKYEFHRGLVMVVPSRSRSEVRQSPSGPQGSPRAARAARSSRPALAAAR
jgi:hypothetical protein